MYPDWRGISKRCLPECFCCLVTQVPARSSPSPGAFLASLHTLGEKRFRSEPNLPVSVMSRSIWWKLGGAIFGVVAPAGTLAFMLWWAKDTGPFEVVRIPVLMRGGLVAFALVFVVATAYLRRRAASLTGFEAACLWVGLAFSFAFALAPVSAQFKLFYAPLGIGPYFWGGLLWGFAISVVAGLVVAITWRRRHRLLE